MASEHWNRTDRLAALGVLAALLALIISVMIPEVRRAIGLSDLSLSDAQRIDSARALPLRPPPGNGHRDSDLTGVWTGSVTQRGYSPYPIIVRLRVGTDGVLVGEASYPTFPCEARWLLIENADRRYHFREQVETGRERCADGIVTIANVATNVLTWTWRESSGRAESAALLERK